MKKLSNITSVDITLKEHCASHKLKGFHQSWVSVAINYLKEKLITKAIKLRDGKTDAWHIAEVIIVNTNSSTYLLHKLFTEDCVALKCQQAGWKDVGSKENRWNRNYRCKMLFFIAAKILNTIIVERIRQENDGRIRWASGSIDKALTR